MTKLLSFILILTVLFHFTYAGNTSIKIKPLAGMFTPSSQDLRNYYNRSAIFIYGIEGRLKLVSRIPGLYVSFQKYDFRIKDRFEIHNKIRVKGSILAAGIFREIDRRQFLVSWKAGLSIHHDDLELVSGEESRIGFQIGAGIQKNIYPHISIYFDGTFDYENLTIPGYCTFAYSRHNNYLSGKSFNTGGFYFSGGILFSPF